MIVGFIMTLHFDLIWSATTHLTSPATVALNVALSTIMSGVGGGVIALVLGKLGNAELRAS
jgi:hypothetical protein